MSLFLRRQAIKIYQKATKRHILERLDELNQNQWLSRDGLLDLQRHKLYRLLEYAYEYVPYYHRLFDRVSFRPADVLSDNESIRRVPVLTKTIVRDNYDTLLTTEPRRRRQMSRLTTGGSTGHPLAFEQDNDFRDHVTADILRHLGWAGWQLGQVHAYIWGASFEVKTSQCIRTKLMDWALDRFLTNAYILSQESMTAFVAQVRRRRPQILFGYPSSLYHFAKFVRESGFDDIKFDAIFSSAEVLYPLQGQSIEKTLGGRVFDRYATRELGGISCECDAHTGMHASIDNNHIEIVRDLDSGELTRPGEAGHIVVTNLNNFGMPFIRYSSEDIGAWSTTTHCSCGRKLPLMEIVCGRRIDMFKTKDTRIVWGGFASPLFAVEGVKQFQLVQKSLDLVVARIVKEGELDQTRLATIERTVKSALGDDVEVRFEFPDEIPVLDSGKYLYTISEVSR